MHELAFLQDLALVMCMAGFVTVLFNRLKQPVVLGYILAGAILSPHTPTHLSISDPHTIKLMSELGVIFLMFSLGLEFSLRKLKKVGIPAFIGAATEILVTFWVGYEIGILFNWGQMNSIFLGAIISISSTTIIVKALDELGKRREKFADLIFGILIVEDILAIVMLALLSGFAATGSLRPSDLAVTIGQISLFLVVVLVIGFLVVPRLLNYIARSNSNEMLLVSVLGMCFGVSLITVKMGYSVALGAFLIGAVMAESRHIATIEHLVQPVRDMFSAVFFVSIGLLIDPHVIYQYWFPIVVISAAVILGKALSCTFAAFISGYSIRSSLGVGMSLAQIGEFSFIIASLGLTLKVTDPFLYPIAIAVSALTTLSTPYLIKSSDYLAAWVDRKAPEPLMNALHVYTHWAREFKASHKEVNAGSFLKQILYKVGVNLMLIAAIFVAGALVLKNGWVDSSVVPGGRNGLKAILWLGAMLLSLPLLIAVYRKLKAFSMLLAEITLPRQVEREGTDFLRAIVGTIILLTCNTGVAILLLILSSTILPPLNVLVVLAIGVIMAAYFLREHLGRLHNRAQIALAETFERPMGEKPEEVFSLPGGFTEVILATVPITDHSPAAGKLISELKVRTRTGASIVSIQRAGHTLINPKVDEELKVGDHILLIGKADKLEDAVALLSAAK